MDGINLVKPSLDLSADVAITSEKIAIAKNNQFFTIYLQKAQWRKSRFSVEK
jgi:hypothetical protein